MSPILSFVIVVWTIILLGLFAIGGYFMFRKFLKSMPKKDGMSDLDWQDYYIDQTLPLWTEEGKQLLNDLVEPVPPLFRDTAKKTIAAKIGELALKENAETISQELIIKGYIIATPKRDHKWLLEHLNKKNIDYTPYLSLLK